MYTSFAEAYGWTFEQIDSTDLEDLFDILIVHELTKDDKKNDDEYDALADAEDEDDVFSGLIRMGGR